MKSKERRAARKQRCTSRRTRVGESPPAVTALGRNVVGVRTFDYDVCPKIRVSGENIGPYASELYAWILSRARTGSVVLGGRAGVFVSDFARTSRAASGGASSTRAQRKQKRLTHPQFSRFISHSFRYSLLSDPHTNSLVLSHC